MSVVKFAKLLFCIALFCSVLCVKGVDEPTFRYVTAYNKEGRLLRSEDIEKTTVNVLKPIIFIINGVDKPEGKSDAWYKDLMEEYLSKQVHNVFLVDWEFDSKFYSSNQTQSIGFFLSEFIETLFNKTGESYLDIHLVGVLAGSRVAAVAGKRVLELTGRKVNRITALDPTYYLINDENTKTDIRDANFVDVVYSDLSKFAKLPEEGHVRFYIDDKKCKEDFGKLMPVKLFAKSINSNKFEGVECESVENFKEGKCDQNKSIVFGENVDRNARGNYFVNACQ
ncbi:lipase member H-like [Tribolium madens]|uniref:lipase member H-like n=1 Tax=Tribolium madens TaxID=41895 RepID=UPI001CF76676|nr:lipase member H-like [Tribolium madens]